jgi:hypothetical protein
MPAVWKVHGMSATNVSRRLGVAIREGLVTFLGVVAVVGIVVGLMYLMAAGALPHLLQGRAHAGHHARRAAACLVAGGACAVTAWLIRDRRQELGSADGGGWP